MAFLLHIRSTTLTVILVNSGEFASPGLWFFYCNERTIELLAPRVKAPSELLRAPVSLSDVNRNEREKIGMVGREAISMHGRGSSESNPTGETGKATEFRKKLREPVVVDICEGLANCQVCVKLLDFYHT